VVDSRVLSRLTDQQHQAIGGLEHVVAELASATRRSAMRTSIALGCTVVGGPVLAVVILFISAFVLLNIEGPIDRDMRFILVDVQGRICAAKVYHHAEGGWVQSFGHYPPPGAAGTSRRPNLDGVQTVGAEWFVGRSGSGHRSGGNEVSGRIERVHGDLMGASAYGVIGRDSVFIEGFCLEPDQAQAP
jgi:hypothetical protein